MKPGPAGRWGMPAPAWPHRLITMLPSTAPTRICPAAAGGLVNVTSGAALTSSALQPVASVALRMVGNALAAGGSPGSEVVLGDALGLLGALIAASSQLAGDLQVGSGSGLPAELTPACPRVLAVGEMCMRPGLRAGALLGLYGRVAVAMASQLQRRPGHQLCA